MAFLAPDQSGASILVTSLVAYGYNITSGNFVTAFPGIPRTQDPEMNESRQILPFPVQGFGYRVLLLSAGF